ncbi:quinone oxidoreductase, NADPH-dependent [Corynebacterium lowii]|uniref:Quinone oxidoreductase, NADPH-dependent n=2 Tax=Corynebacterium lowii TaxID=1544413 RepID=A0A0Q0Z7Y1_9CORY|nr:quinone oxidoreductase, NADPH-dependent [Corynebacterium lowii]
MVAIASEQKHEWLRGLGAYETVDYHDAQAMAAIEPVDVVYSLAPGSFEAALKAVKKGGILISLGAGSADVEEKVKAAGVRFAATHVRTQREWLEGVIDLAGRGVLLPTVSEVFDLKNAAEAHRALESGHTQGKIVLRATSQD